MIIQARSALAEILRELLVAGREHENTVRLIDRLLRDKSAHVRTEVLSGFLGILFGSKPRKRLVRNAYIMVALVVFQQDIVLWLVLLDKAAFEQQRLVLGVNYDIVVVVHVRHHCRDLRRVVGILTEIARDAVFEILCLSYIYYLVALILHQVNSRGSSQPRSLVTQIWKSWVHFCSFRVITRADCRMAGIFTQYSAEFAVNLHICRGTGHCLSK